MKLQQIQFLKKLGFSLQEIAEMLADREWNWATSLQKQLLFVVQEQEKLKQMEAALRGLLNSMAVEGETSWPVIQNLIRLSENPPALRQAFRKQMFEEHERELLELLPNMNRDDPDSLEWIALLGQLKQNMNEGPGSPEVQRIIGRMDEKRIADFDGEEAFVEKLWEIRKSADQSERMGLYPIEEEVLELLEEAFAIYTAGKAGQTSERGER